MRRALRALRDGIRGGDSAADSDASDPRPDGGHASEERSSEETGGTGGVPEITRRQAVAGVVGGGGVVGGFRALDNVVLGYGVLVGTNLVAQDLGSLAGERLGPERETFALADGRSLLYDEGTLTVRDAAGRHTAALDVAGATDADADERARTASSRAPDAAGPSRR